MSRKNRNARRQSNKPLNTQGIQLSLDTIPAKSAENNGVVRMLDETCSYEFICLFSSLLFHLL